MPLAKLSHSPLAGGPAEIYYRDSGSGRPLVFLHGGWGYGIYPLDLQEHALKGFRVIIPDRSGYGRSTRPALFDLDLHRRAAEETLLFLDSIGIPRCIFWGHSDGAVIAAMLGLTAPERCLGLILEAFHYDCEKPRSRAFFETMRSGPEAFGARTMEVLRQEHGDPYWRELMRAEGQVWLDLAQASSNGRRDLLGGRLSGLHVPAAFIHGAQDPRTEPWELDAIRRELPNAEMHVIASGGHSPHSETAAAKEFNRCLEETLARWSDKILFERRTDGSCG